MQSKAWKATLVLLVFSVILWLFAHRQQREQLGQFTSLGASEFELADTDRLAVEMAFQQKISGQALPSDYASGTELENMTGPVVLRLWRDGRTLAEAWEDEGNWAQNLSQILDSFPAENLFGATTAEVEFCYNFEALDWQDEDGLKKLNIDVGLRGLEMLYGGVLERISPHKMSIKGDNFQRTKNRFLRTQGQDPRATVREGFESRSFSTAGLLLSLAEKPRSISLTRTNTLLAPGQSAEQVESLRKGLISAFETAIEKNPRLPYLYYPVDSSVSYRREVAVRQSLGLWSLARLARLDPSKTSLFERCLKATLRNYYSTDGTLGFITPPNKRDNRAIGEIALFGLALHEGPFRGQFPDIEAALLKTTDDQWNEDGSFRCFIGSEDRIKGIEFYPGETLVYWASLYRDKPNPERLERIMKSFEYYRNYHLNETRRAAFVPWHTQAYVTLWESTKDPKLAEFVFEMNDWLAEFSLWDKAPTPDLRGAIWDPQRPEHGSVPHVSSTGVYLEGMVKAYKLALAMDDTERTERYRRVIQRAIYSLRQHQYSGFDDLYYIPEPEGARGQLRGQLGKQMVRIDNNAHALLALLALTEVFEPKDYEF